jgi:hypothetical protein
MTPQSFSVFFLFVALLCVLKSVLKDNRDSNADVPQTAKLDIVSPLAAVSRSIPSGIVPGERGAHSMQTLPAWVSTAPQDTVVISPTTQEQDSPAPSVVAEVTSMSVVDDALEIEPSSSHFETLNEEPAMVPVSSDDDQQEWLIGEQHIHEWD